MPGLANRRLCEADPPAGHCPPQVQWAATRHRTSRQGLWAMWLRLKGPGTDGHDQVDATWPCCLEGRIENRPSLDNNCWPLKTSPSEVLPSFQAGQISLQRGPRVARDVSAFTTQRWGLAFAYLSPHC